MAERPGDETVTDDEAGGTTTAEAKDTGAAAKGKGKSKAGGKKSGKKGAAGAPGGDPVAVDAPSPQLSIVTSLSLLAGAVAAYPSLEGVMSGSVEPIRAATVFLAATLVAMVGFGAVSWLFEQFSGATDPDGALDGASGDDTGADGLGEGSMLDQDDQIAAALAATDALVHSEAGSS